MVEHNLAPEEIRFLTLASGCKTEQRFTQNAEIAQLVEHNLAKVRVASSSLVFRSRICESPGGGMVDALVSGASVERRAGSSPVLGT